MLFLVTLFLSLCFVLFKHVPIGCVDLQFCTQFKADIFMPVVWLQDFVWLLVQKWKTLKTKDSLFVPTEQAIGGSDIWLVNKSIWRGESEYHTYCLKCFQQCLLGTEQSFVLKHAGCLGSSTQCASTQSLCTFYTTASHSFPCILALYGTYSM